MAPFIDQFMAFLSIPQGNLIVSMVLGVLAFGAFQACLYASGRQFTAPGARMRRGLLYLLLAQMVMFTVSWIAWIGLIDEHTFLPPIERTIAIFSLVIIIWLWVFPEPLRIADWITSILEVVIVLVGGFSIYWWAGHSTGMTFNSSIIGAYAYYTGIVLVVMGLILLIWRRPAEWEYGVGMLVIMLGGYIAQFFIKQPAGDYPWLVRMGEMASYTILLALPRRLVTIQEGKQSAESTQPRQEKLLFQSFLDLVNEKVPTLYYQKLLRLVARVMDAQSSVLVMPPQNGEHLIVPMGYNALEDKLVDGFTVDGKQNPPLMEAVKAGKSWRTDSTSPAADVYEFLAEMGATETTQMMLAPLQNRDSERAMSVMVFSKSPTRAWEEKDNQQLEEILRLISCGPVTDVGESEKTALKEEVVHYQQMYEQLKAQFDELQQPAGSEGVFVESPTALLLMHKKMQDTIQSLESRNQELELQVMRGRSPSEEVEQLRQELRAALEDLARMPTTLSKSDQKMLEVQLSALKRLDELGQTELVNSIAQEIRQPLSSILGYTDLLLGESVGILGAMQRRFLERVKASAERLGTLTNDLVEVLAIDGGTLDQTLDKVELESVVDDAVGEVIGQVSEKNITMRVDLPAQLPTIQANKDGLQQILTNLLQNACLVTPVEGEIRLFARVETKDDEPNYLLISVSDQGGGITKADMPRIFQRHYKDENPSIPGIGDTGVGLSIVKSLVELNKGRVWVDTREGSGSTFSCVIPLIIDQPMKVTQAAEN